jgi:chromosome segregation ATPase
VYLVNKTKNVIIFHFILNIFLLVGLSDVGWAAKEGRVIKADNEFGVILVSLGEGEVNEGDVIDIYRGSRHLATFSINKVQGRVSSAWLKEKVQDLNVAPNDKVLVVGRGADMLEDPLSEEEDLYSYDAPSYAEMATEEVKPSAVQKTTQEAQSEIANLRKERDETVAKLKAEIDAVIKARQEAESSLKNQSAAADKEKAALDEKISGLENSKKILEAELKQVRDALKKSTEDNTAQINVRLSNLLENEAKLREEVSLLKQDSVSRETALYGKIRNLDKEKAALAAKVSELESSRVGVSGKGDALVAELNALNREKDAAILQLRQDLVELERSKEKSKKDYDSEIAALTGAKEKIENSLKSQLADVSKENNYLKNQLNFAQKQSKEAEEELKEGLSAANKDQQQSILQLKSQLANLDKVPARVREAIKTGYRHFGERKDLPYQSALHYR